MSSPGEGRPAAAAGGGGGAHHLIESMIRGYFLLISGRYRVTTKGFKDFFLLFFFVFCFFWGRGGGVSIAILQGG